MNRMVRSHCGVPIIGFDTEYQTGASRNEILSYQTFGILGDHQWRWMDVDPGCRITLDRLIGQTLLAGKRAGAFKQYPREIVLVGHFSRADLPMLSDFDELKPDLDVVRDTLITLGQPVKVRWTDGHGRKHPIAIIIRDTVLLAANKTPLAKIGSLHGVNKIELPEGSLDDMKGFLNHDRATFEQYGATDAEIAAKHALFMADLNRQMTGNFAVPVTLSSLGVEACLRYWEQHGIDPHRVMGTTPSHTLVYRNARYITKKSAVPMPGRLHWEELAKLSYHGGRNESFHCGATGADEWIDVDLKGAYSTALASIGTPDYAHALVTTKPGDFGPDAMGFAYVRFKFPADTRYPSLPMRTQHGLVFPLEGFTHATGPEIFLARLLGADLEIKLGVVIPTGSPNPFGGFLTDMTRRRDSHRHDRLMETMIKEIINSIYGRVAQAVHPRSVFDSHTGGSKAMGPSRISNAFMAAHTTGLVRAVVGEILSRIPPSREIVSVTTDGFLTNARLDEILVASRGPVAMAFAASRANVSGNAEILEVKHRAREVLSMRTRGTAALEPEPGHDPILVRPGIQTPKNLSLAQQNDWVVQLFAHRTYDSMVKEGHFTPLREMILEGGDLVRQSRDKRLRIDFDWKRQPDDIKTRSIQGVPHVAFNTKPWSTADEFLQVRTDWTQFNRQTRRCLKTENDLEAFMAYRAGSHLPKRGLRRAVNQPPVTVALRQIARAFVRGEWGLGNMNRRAFCNFMKEGGYEVSLDDLKNAGKPTAKLIEHAIHPTDDILRLCNHVKKRFPDFIASLLLST